MTMFLGLNVIWLCHKHPVFSQIMGLVPRAYVINEEIKSASIFDFKKVLINFGNNASAPFWDLML